MLSRPIAVTKKNPPGRRIPGVLSGGQGSDRAAGTLTPAFGNRFHEPSLTAGPLLQMAIHRLRHLEHVQLLAAKYRLQLLIRQNLSLVLRILQIVFLDVFPDFLCDLASG